MVTRREYDITNDVFDKLEERDVEIDELTATVVRSMSASLSDLLDNIDAFFGSEDE